MLEMTTGLYTFYGRKNSIDRRKLKSRRKKHEQDQKRRLSSIWRQETTRNQDPLPQRLGVNSLPNATSNSKAFFVDSCDGQEQEQEQEHEQEQELEQQRQEEDNHLYRDESLANGTFDWSDECPSKTAANTFPDADKQKYHTTATPFLNPNG